MPWKETDAMQERVKFVLDWERRWKAGQGLVNMSELCRIFGVSRQTGYVWLDRYMNAGRDLRAMEDRSRKPLSSPTAVDSEVERMIVAARKAHSTWGPRKLNAWLQNRFPNKCFPAASTVGDILKRNGLVQARRRRRRRCPTYVSPFAPANNPNAVWCMDFKGHFRTGDGEVCYPFTVSDAFSRYLIRCEIVEEPDSDAVQDVLDSAFCEFGIPLAIRSDNGPPFASNAAGGLTRLAVWLLRLGIRLNQSS